MVVERNETDEFEAWPTSGDPDRVAMAFASVMSAIIEAVPDGPVRAQAVTVAMEAHGAVRALLSRPRLN
jgi:hypothetical protein